MQLYEVYMTITKPLIYIYICIISSAQIRNIF